MKFVILASSYDENVGGIIVSHKLCHILNELGHEAYLYPISHSLNSFTRRVFSSVTSKAPFLRRLTGRGFRMNSAFDTRLLPLAHRSTPEDAVMIYGDEIIGNPLNANHVVRWFLHKPGYHKGVIQHGTGEFHIDFDEFLKGYDPGGNFLSDRPLHVIHYPLEIYHQRGAAPSHEREGIAYSVRKGTFVAGAFDHESAICIDGLSHQECAAIFRRVRRFYSFDPFTAYSPFAALCGAISIVVPPAGMERSDWYAKDSSRYGIAFGKDDEPWAVATMDKVRPEFEAREKKARGDVEHFAHCVASYFGI